MDRAPSLLVMTLTLDKHHSMPAALNKV